MCSGVGVGLTGREGDSAETRSRGGLVSHGWKKKL